MQGINISVKSGKAHLADLKCFCFSDRCELDKSMIKNLAFAIIYSYDLMQNGWVIELSAGIK